MTNFFADEEIVEVLETAEQFNEIEVEPELEEVPSLHLDARRRLENILEEKKLREELDDFVDY